MLNTCVTLHEMNGGLITPSSLQARATSSFTCSCMLRIIGVQGLEFRT
jgi:hypothetical protein